MPKCIRGRRVRFQKLFFDRGVRIVLLNGLQIRERFRIAAQHPLRLRHPVQRVFAQQRIILRFGQPRKGLRRAIFRVVVVSQGQRGARTPKTGGVLIRKCRQFFVRSGRRASQIVREVSHLFLQRLLFRGGRGAFRNGSVRPATATARRAFGLFGFFLTFGCLRSCRRGLRGLRLREGLKRRGQ